MQWHSYCLIWGKNLALWSKKKWMTKSWCYYIKVDITLRRTWYSWLSSVSALGLCRVWLRTGYQLPRLARLADIRRARSRAICFYHTTSPARLIRWGGQQRRITQIQEISKSVPAWYKTTKICNHSSHPLIRSFVAAWVEKKPKKKLDKKLFCFCLFCSVQGSF